MRVLVAVEGSAARKTARLLHENGFVVDAATTVDEAVTALCLTKYDAILLDLGLGRSDVLDLVMQRRGQARVIAASGRTASTISVDALNRGADDVISLESEPAEILARIRAVLRRSARTTSEPLNMEDISLDAEAGAVRIAGTLVNFPRREFTILEVLLRANARPVSRDKLEKLVFSDAEAVTHNALEAAMSRLRRHLHENGTSLTVVALRNNGYALAHRGAMDIEIMDKSSQTP